MSKVDDVIRWKHPDAEYVMRGGVLAMWSHPSVPRPTQAVLLSWAAEYDAAGAGNDQRFTDEQTDILKAIVQATWELHRGDFATAQEYRQRIREIRDQL